MNPFRDEQGFPKAKGFKKIGLVAILESSNKDRLVVRWSGIYERYDLTHTKDSKLVFSAHYFEHKAVRAQFFRIKKQIEKEMKK